MMIQSSKRNVQVFLGMVVYYRRFIPNFAKIADPLFYLLKNNTTFSWTKDCQQSFEQLTKLLSTSPILAYPDFDWEFIVQTDASLSAIGAVLSQVNNLGEEHPIAFFSRTLNSHKRNYTVTERECLAVICAYKQFQVYIHGTKFTVVTNHASLSWLQNLKEPEGRLARWALKLQQQNFKIIYRVGACHQNADGLSCLPLLPILA